METPNAEEKGTKAALGFGLVVESEILTQMACRQDCCTGYEEVTSQTAETSEWLEFEFYEVVTFDTSLVHR